MKLDCIHFVWVHECAPVEVESDPASERKTNVDSSNPIAIIKAAFVASLDRINRLTHAHMAPQKWHVIPDLPDRVAHSVLNMSRLRLHVGNDVPNRHSWVSLAHELRTNWGVYTLFSSGRMRDIDSRADLKDMIAFVGTSEEIRMSCIREEEAVNVRVFNSESMDAVKDLKAFVKGHIQERFK